MLSESEYGMNAGLILNSVRTAHSLRAALQKNYSFFQSLGYKKYALHPEIPMKNNSLQKLDLN